MDLAARNAEAFLASGDHEERPWGIAASETELGDYFLYCEGNPSLIFTENETNNQRILGTPDARPYAKDGINDFVVAGKQEAVNPGLEGTKAAANYQLEVGPGQTAAIRLRLTKTAPDSIGNPFGDHFSQMLERRQQEADEFYRAVTPASVHEDAARVMRQALAGMLWTKQYYFFDLARWHGEHGRDPAQARGLATRNREWAHMVNDAVISMRTNGNIHGSRPGTWRFTRSRSRRSTSISRSASSN